MPSDLTIAFIGFGEAGQAFAGSLRAHASVTIRAFDVLAGTAGGSAIEAAAARLGVALGDGPRDAARGADLVVSAVTAAQSLEALRPLEGFLGPGQVVLDINSVSARRKAETAALVRAGGAVYVDMAVMSPVHPHAHRTPVLVAGDLAPGTVALLDALDFRYEIAGPDAGDAAAVKMVRSLFVKGLEAVTVQALAAAEAAGCRDRVLASLAGSFPGLGWPGFAAYQFERVGTHGLRRAAELREVAASMAELGFPEGEALASAIADLQEAAGRAGIAPAEDPAIAAARFAAALRHDGGAAAEPPTPLRGAIAAPGG
jgi:3-hydroxyisobutyrate dehydrogenase-like beta-hydroxyacid dehydrogenase